MELAAQTPPSIRLISVSFSACPLFLQPFQISFSLKKLIDPEILCWHSSVNINIHRSSWFETHPYQLGKMILTRRIRADADANTMSTWTAAPPSYINYRHLTSHGETSSNLFYAILILRSIIVARCAITGLKRLFKATSWIRTQIKGKRDVQAQSQEQESRWQGRPQPLCWKGTDYSRYLTHASCPRGRVSVVRPSSLIFGIVFRLPPLIGM